MIQNIVSVCALNMSLYRKVILIDSSVYYRQIKMRLVLAIMEMFCTNIRTLTTLEEKKGQTLWRCSP